MPGYEDKMKKYSRQSHSLLSLNIDSIYCNGYKSPAQSSSDTCSLKSNNYDTPTRTSKYHCNCHVIPETDSYLTPLQKKTLLLKELKKEIKELEKNGNLKDKKIKNLEEQVAQLHLNKKSKEKTLYLNIEENIEVEETNVFSILYNKISENLAEIKEDLKSLNTCHHNILSTSATHRKSQTPPVRCAKTHSHLHLERLESVQCDLDQLNIRAQEFRARALVAAEFRAEHKARLGFLRDALYHYLLGLGKNEGIALRCDNMHYKALVAILKLTPEQRSTLQAFDI